MKNFKDLMIRSELVKRLDEMCIITPTEIQQKVIPLLIDKPTDLVGQAQTGTGKTVAFGLPLLQKINSKKKYIQGLVLCPTRELGQQVAKQLFRFSKYSDKIFIEAVYGGERIEKQISNLTRTTHILVATPGRMLDLLKRRAVNLKHVRTLILDEADEMLSMGFKKELDDIFNFLPSIDSKWLFSATISEDINRIIIKNMSPNAHKIISARANIVNKKIKHNFVLCDDRDKFNIVLQFLNSVKGQRGIIFCRTRNDTKKLANSLVAKNIYIGALHGDLLQKERNKVMRAFKNKILHAIVATDIAARGIDIANLTYVVHYQLPDQDEYYIHRSGRTARAGKEGVSLVLANRNEMRKIRVYEEKLKISFSKIKPAK